jgi:hypothetical protein
MVGGRCGEGDIDFGMVFEILHQVEFGVSFLWKWQGRKMMGLVSGESSISKKKLLKGN